MFVPRIDRHHTADLHRLEMDTEMVEVGVNHRRHKESDWDLTHDGDDESGGADKLVRTPSDGTEGAASTHERLRRLGHLVIRGPKENEGTDYVRVYSLAEWKDPDFWRAVVGGLPSLIPL